MIVCSSARVSLAALSPNPTDPQVHWRPILKAKEYRQHRFKRPPGATEILLVRHGESEPAKPDEPFPLLEGHGNPKLALPGREQALRVGDRLRRLPIRAVYVTKLRRTQETARPLCAHLHLEPIIEYNLHEVNLGDWEGGRYRMKAAEKDPIFVRLQHEQRWDIIPGAEPADVFHERIHRGLNNIAAENPDRLVAAFVHGGVIGHIIAHATGASPFAFNDADNGSISHIVFHKGNVIVRRFNDTAHLDDLIFDLDPSSKR
jgi:2,3-bisphosphoglycerate-dependent phosphoglycerate mutase